MLMEPTIVIAVTVRQEYCWPETRNRLVRGVYEGKISMHPTLFISNSAASRANSQATGPSIAVDISEKCFYSSYKLRTHLYNLCYDLHSKGSHDCRVGPDSIAREISE